eukprot:jgi/Botrbrau1/14275/Bobra.0368s0007.1
MRRMADNVLDGGSWMGRPASLAASNGHWECLQFLISAARSGQLQILQKLVDLDPDLLHSPSFFEAAAQGGSLDCLDFLMRAGCTWDKQAAASAARSGNSEALRKCLLLSRDTFQERDWKDAMREAISSGSPDCMQALYECGYQSPAADSSDHPARLAIFYTSLPCLRLAVELSGEPQLSSEYTMFAARGGEEMLRLVHEQVGTMYSSAAEDASHAGQVGALQYALRHGAHLSVETLAHAISGGSVECLKYAFEHGLRIGFPAEYSQWSSRHFRLHRWEDVTRYFKVLRYVCEVMRPRWTQQFLTQAAGQLARSKWKRGKDVWKVCLYIASRINDSLPPPLDELVRVRRERAKALAGSFIKQSSGLKLWGPRHRWHCGVPWTDCPSCCRSALPLRPT